MTDARQTHAYLDALRGLAILMVVLHHFAAIAKTSIPLVGVYGGLVGVQLFFVISGYLIAKSADVSSIGRYAIARFARIFPAYWAVYLSIGLVIHWSTLGKVSQTPFPFILNLLNLQQLDPVALLDFNVIGVSWTLTVELIWYVLAPLVLVYCRGHRGWALIAILLVSVVWTLLADGGYLGWLFDARLGQVAAPLHLGHRELLINSAFPAHLVHFGWGLAIYWYRIQLSQNWAVLAGMAGLCGLALMPQFINKIPLSHVLSGFSVALVFLAAKSLPNVQIPVLGSLGLISYSVYLLHVPIIGFVCNRIEGGVLAQSMVAAGLVLVLSYVSYRLIELPFIGLGRRISTKLSNRA